MWGRNIVIFVILVVSTVPNFNTISVQKRYTPLLFQNKFWQSNQSLEQHDKNPVGKILVEMKKALREFHNKGNEKF